MRLKPQGRPRFKKERRISISFAIDPGTLEKIDALVKVEYAESRGRVIDRLIEEKREGQ